MGERSPSVRSSTHTTHGRQTQSQPFGCHSVLTASSATSAGSATEVLFVSMGNNAIIAVNAMAAPSVNMISNAIDAASAMAAPSVNMISDAIDAANAMGAPSANTGSIAVYVANAMGAQFAGMIGGDPPVKIATASYALSAPVSMYASAQPQTCKATCSPSTRTTRRP